MHGEFSKLLSNYIFIFTIFEMNLPPLIHGNCTDPITKNKLKHITCSEGKYSIVPDYLNNKIESLAIENSKISTLGRNSFTKYKYLTMLSIINSEIAYIKDDDYLSQIPKLKILELIRVSIPNIQNTSFPVNLTSLNISGNKITSFNAKKLIQLVYFNGSNNEMKKLPAFNTSPMPKIQLIDVNGNKDIVTTKEEIMLLCTLKAFYADLFKYIKSYTQEDYCICNYLMVWFRSHFIKHNFVDCYWNYTGEMKWCTFKISEYIVIKSQQCFENLVTGIEKRSKGETGKRSFPYFLTILLLLLIIIVGIMAYLAFKRRIFQRLSRGNQKVVLGEDEYADEEHSHMEEELPHEGEEHKIKSMKRMK